MLINWSENKSGINISSIGYNNKNKLGYKNHNSRITSN